MSCPSRGTWHATWTYPSDSPWQAPPSKEDYRDFLPPPLEEVVKAYTPHVRYGKWTFGLCDMWTARARFVKSAVHIPCWQSFRVDARQWRGIVLGRNCGSCYFTGCHCVRWSRAVHATRAGREYTYVYETCVPEGAQRPRVCFCCPDSERKRRICCVSLVDIGVAVPFSFCVGHLLTWGTGCCNFSACYECHSREKLRRKYNLPPAFIGIPGCDDCCVHFFCAYCASHQELRELAVRGIDGPGLHILDVLPQEFEHVKDIDAAVDARAQVVEALKHQQPPFAACEDSGLSGIGFSSKPGDTARQAPAGVPRMERFAL